MRQHLEIWEIGLTDKDKAYIKLIGHHWAQTKALLADLAGPGPDGNPAYTRELALANTRLEEAYYHAREHVMRAAQKRNAVN